MISPKLDAFWTPFTPSRQFKAEPRLVVSAQGLLLIFDEVITALAARARYPLACPEGAPA
jgi:adenosylmethionine-8-amino-7-oxononanoate aminotransferase